MKKLVTLFSPDDYPPEAMAAMEEGTVATELAIGPDGRVSRCTVVESASPSLDAKTCAILSARASYRPARDRRGRPMVGSDHARVRWVIPHEPPPLFAPEWMQVVAVVPASGPNRCTSSSSRRRPLIDQRACDALVRANDAYRPQTLTRPYVVTIRQEQTTDGTVAPLLPGSGLARIIVRQRINPAGKVTACEKVPDLSPGIDDTPWFNCRINDRFDALPDTGAERKERILTISWMRSYDTMTAGER